MKNKFRFGVILQACITLFCILLYIAERLSKPFSSLVNDTFSAKIRLILSKIMGIFPFSVFEILVFAGIIYLSAFLVILIIYASKKLSRKKTGLPIKKLAAVIPCVLSVFLNLFILTLAPSYNTASVAEKMGLETEISEEKLFSATKILVKMVGEDEKGLLSENGETQYPYSFSETEKLVLTAADSFSEKYPFYQKNTGTAKRLLFSKPLTYTFITGIYSPTGESNINSNFPQIGLAPTMAHEFSHARGVAPENECNFLGFCVCLESSDCYIRYCGEISLLDDLCLACKKTDAARYKAEILPEIPERVYFDYAAKDSFLEKYQTPVADISDSVNSAYLKSQGQKKGTVSYSETVEITVSYILKTFN